jgi:hypothetical protein
MSFEAQAWARTVRCGSPTKKAVLMDIANNYNNIERCAWTSQKRIAFNTELSERAVRGALSDLEDMKIIWRKSRKNTTDLIFLSMPDPDEGKFAVARRPDNDNQQRQQMPVGQGHQRHQMPAPAATDAGGYRNDVPVVAAPAAGDERQDVPVVAERGAGADRQELPPNHYTNPLSKPSDEPSKKPNKRRGPAALFPDDAFDRWWAIWPNKVQKPYAKACFDKLANAGDVEFSKIMDGTDRYVANKPKDRPWLNPSTFINQHRFDDETPGDQTKHGQLKANRKFVI